MVRGGSNGVGNRHMLFEANDEDATPLTSCGDDLSIAIDITEDDSDDGSVIFAGGGAAGGLGRDKWGNIISTCGIEGCRYKTGKTSAMKGA
ncbi:hypothetical protein TrLO_g13668 [Triparma laevis f. longispina]|uniref:Uncharacterized protein n=1 Tax=Triparma laevis f. longispina TaxID=1714387 RepID=A0A9W7DTY9_9STRA|nr:hypothetical protein TrLO_g13668 [Triparma laevis f. longispina]